LLLTVNKATFREGLRENGEGKKGKGRRENRENRENRGK